MADEQAGKSTPSWSDLLDRMIDIGLGAASLTADTAQKLVNELVARGQVAREESSTLVERLLTLGREQREALREQVEKTTERMIDNMQLVRKSEVDALRARLETMEATLAKHTCAGTSHGSTMTSANDKDYQLDQE